MSKGGDWVSRHKRKQIHPSSTLLSCPSPQWVRERPPASLVRGICFAQATNSSANLSQKRCHRHTQKEHFIIYLGTCSPSQVDT